MEQVIIPQPLFQTPFLNIQFIFEKIYTFLKDIYVFLVNSQTWNIIGIISVVSSIFFLAIIIFSLVRLIEIQIDESREIDDEIKESIQKEKEKIQNKHPRWGNIQKLSESDSESDWRVSIIEADSMLEESLKNKGVIGDTVGELLEATRSSGYKYIQDAWDAHIMRNKIAHEGSKEALSKIETRRTIRMFQKFFEELDVI